MSTLPMLSGFRLEEDGFVYPAHDLIIPRILRRWLGHVDEVVAYCPKRQVVVQAGGNCGLWPRRFAQLFEAVYTFEPDPVNFAAMAMNTADLSNVVRLQAALGASHGFVDLNRTGKNCGAHYVEGAGLLPTLCIDDLGLLACDLIYLDVEGSELAALRGAVRTIGLYNPVIAFEDKGLGQRFGVPLGTTEHWLADTFGYVTVAKNNDDFVMVRAMPEAA